MKLSVISGGTAANALVPIFNRLGQDEQVSYILPVSDNGGSTLELIRVLSGPAVGDIRSRLTRFIPADEDNPEDIENVRIKNLLSHRLPASSELLQREWGQIVDGTSPLWDGIQPGCKEMFRSFLIHVHMELLKRSRGASSYRFELLSVGNLFLTGARLFCGSLDSAIELFLRLTRVPTQIQVLPCLNTNFTYHISALLEDNTIITGQSQISHPLPEEGPGNNAVVDLLNSVLSLSSSDIVKTMTSPTIVPGVSNQTLGLTISNDDLLIHKLDQETEEYLTPSYIHPDLKKSNLHFSKDDQIPLAAPISRIFYISPYGEEIFPSLHTRVLKLLSESSCIVYSIGSLMTSTIPVLILQGVGKLILSGMPNGQSKNKVLLLNGINDRETHSLTLSGFVRFIVKSLEYSLHRGQLEDPDYVDMLDWSQYVTHLVHLPSHLNIELDFDILRKKQIKLIEVPAAQGNPSHYDLSALEEVLLSLDK